MPCPAQTIEASRFEVRALEPRRSLLGNAAFPRQALATGQVKLEDNNSSALKVRPRGVPGEVPTLSRVWR